MTRISKTNLILISLTAAAALGCHASQPAPATNPAAKIDAPVEVVPGTRPIPRYILSSDRDAVESFFAAANAGDVRELKSIVTPDHADGIGGRTWEMWIRDCRNMRISNYGFRVADHHFFHDQIALHVFLSSGEELTVYLVTAGTEYHISSIDRTRSAATQP